MHLHSEQQKFGETMQIEQSLCHPEKCNLECRGACISTHGEEPPIIFGGGSPYPTIDKESCTQCLMCIRACPYNAITADETAGKKRTKDYKVRDDKPTYVPYSVSDDLAEFSEADMIFARVRNDPDFKNYQQDEWYGAETMISKQIQGYGKFELEMAKAGWTLYDYRGEINPKETDFADLDSEINSNEYRSPELTREIKRAALFYGASLVGIANLDRRWLYSSNRQREQYNIPEPISNVIVMAIEMDYTGIATSPAFTSAANTALGYSRMAFLEIELSALIRKLGYTAIPCGNDISLSIPQAIDAGLGMIGRNGLLITKEFGPRVRIAKVLTDMPLQPDSPDNEFCESVTRFCEACEKCAKSCPSQSIPYGNERTWNGETRSNNPGVEKWYVNPEGCYSFWVQNGSDCSNCIRSCPYNKRNNSFHRFILWLIEHMPWINRLIVRLDDLMGYGKQKNPTKYMSTFEKN